MSISKGRGNSTSFCVVGAYVLLPVTDFASCSYLYCWGSDCRDPNTFSSSPRKSSHAGDGKQVCMPMPIVLNLVTLAYHPITSSWKYGGQHANLKSLLLFLLLVSAAW